MNRLPLSSAAAALYRALANRSGVSDDQLRISDAVSGDWYSLTLDGERHRFDLRLVGPGAFEAAIRLSHGLEDAEFQIPGWIVADIATVAGPERQADGSVDLIIEALTIRE